MSYNLGWREYLLVSCYPSHYRSYVINLDLPGKRTPAISLRPWTCGHVEEPGRRQRRRLLLLQHYYWRRNSGNIRGAGGGRGGGGGDRDRGGAGAAQERQVPSRVDAPFSLSRRHLGPQAASVPFLRTGSTRTRPGRAQSRDPRDFLTNMCSKLL